MASEADNLMKGIQHELKNKKIICWDINILGMLAIIAKNLEGINYRLEIIAGKGMEF